MNTDTTEMSDDEIKAGLRQHVMSVLFKDHNAQEPVYRHDLKSEADCDRKRNELPLVYVWSERQTPQGLAFSVSVNTKPIAEELLKLMDRNHPWFCELRDQLGQDLRSLNMNALWQTCSELNVGPSTICKGWDGS